MLWGFEFYQDDRSRIEASLGARVRYWEWQTARMTASSLLRFLGSLRLGAVILMLLVVAMAAATVYEVGHGTPQTQKAFYTAAWFEWLLGLLAVNVAASMAIRFPWRARQAGFVITHVSILLILGGAWVTSRFAIEGQLGLWEGQSASAFTMPRDTLHMANVATEQSVSWDIHRLTDGGFDPMTFPTGPTQELGELDVTLDEYLPDSQELRHVLNNNPEPRLAVEVCLNAEGEPLCNWVFSGQSSSFAGIPVLLREVEDEESWRTVSSQPASTQPIGEDKVIVEVEGERFEFDLSETRNDPVAIGETGLTVQVTQYLPHAQVGAGGAMTNLSDRAINPAIVAEFSGPEGSFKKTAFARFPEFQGMHADAHPGVRLQLETAEEPPPSVPLEIVSGPDGQMVARMQQMQQGGVLIEPLPVGEAIDTPWPGIRLSVRQRFEHARVDRQVVPPETVRDQRVPAVRVTATIGDGEQELWLRKYEPQRVVIGQQVYELTFRDRQAALGYKVTLDDFRIGRYPGTQRPRSFESSITISDPSTGRSQSRVVSMNQPTSHGGYTLYQSSYREQDGREASILSVAWDPGQLIVFAGYVGLGIGMFWVLIQRMRQGRKPQAADGEQG